MSIDLATHNECIAFIRKAFTAADQEFAQQIAAILKDCCQRGYADRAAICNELTPSPANRLPRTDDLRIRKFTPKNLSYSHV